MADNMPFQTTKVPITKTQLDIKELLYGVGFNRIAELSDDTGNSILIAELTNKDNSASFKFEVNYKKIQDKMCAWEDDRCLRVAWRIVYHQIKSLCDSIKGGIVTIPEAFGGLMLIKDNSGNAIKMADFLTTNLVNGSLTSDSIVSKFMLTDKSGSNQ